MLPSDVLADQSLTPEQKRKALLQCAREVYLLELELSKGELPAEPSRLTGVIDTLLDLDESQAGTADRRRKGPESGGVARAA